MFQHICYKFHIWLNVTYLLTPWSTVLLEKLTGFAANQEIPPVLWNNQKVHTVLTSARHLSLSWANSNIISLFLFLLHDASSRNTPPGDPSGGVFYLRIVLSPEEASRPRIFLNHIFSWGGVVSASPNPQAGRPPLVCCPRLLIQFIHSYPPYQRTFLPTQPEDAPCRGDRDPQTRMIKCYNS